MRYGYWDTEWETEIFCHFRPCLSSGLWICHHFTYLYQKSQPYDVCFLRYKCNRRNSFVIFYTFTPLLTPKIKVWKKCKKTTGDIIFLQMCTINEDHMVYGSWDIRHDRQSFLSSRTIFCLLTLLTTQKIKILKKYAKHLGILSLYTCVPQITIMWCMVSDSHYIYIYIYIYIYKYIHLWFWTIFPLQLPSNLENENFEKMKKLPGGILFYTCAP